MNTLQYRKKDRSSVWHPYTRFSRLRNELFPVIVRGDGIYLHDSDGNRWFDAVSSWWACPLGHGNRRIIAAITRQARRLQHSILGNLSHPAAIELADRLIGFFPDRKRRVMFASDGASAVEAALKIAIQYGHNIGRPERNRLVSLREAYHGDTLGAVSVGRLETFHRPFDSVLFPVLRAESPCCGTCIHGRDPGSCALECFASMRRIVEKQPRRIAAVIVEPLCQGAAGMRIYSPRYLRALAALCARHGILLIADEVAVGMGRTGRMFAFEHAGIDPDIVCLGKGLSGGYLPISATVVKERIFRTFGDRPEDHTFYHGHTFAGNPIAAAAAIETLKIFKEKNIAALAARSGRRLAAALQRLRALPGVADVRCLGMIGAVELEAGRKGCDHAQAVRRALLRDRILVRPLGNVVYLMPPLITPPAVLARTVRDLARAISET